MPRELEEKFPFKRLNEKDVDCANDDCHDEDDAVVLTQCCNKPLCPDCAEDAMRITKRGNIRVECPIDEDDCPEVIVRLPKREYADSE